MRNKTYELYITKNNINGYVYGGKHSYSNKRGIYLGSGFRLKRAFKKYGKENFYVRILRLQLTSEEDMNAREIRLIRLLKYLFKDKCYNIHRGGSGGDYCKYLTAEERLKVNYKISESKKIQYKNGETELQRLGRQKQSATLKEKNLLDLEYRERMNVAYKLSGKRRSERIATKGLTEREKERNKNNSLYGLKQFKLKIIYPCGNVIFEDISSKRFKKKYKTDDSLFSTLKREGYFKVKKRSSVTKHPFPAATAFFLIKD